MRVGNGNLFEVFNEAGSHCGGGGLLDEYVGPKDQSLYRSLRI
jgi:hypothetical protein